MPPNAPSGATHMISRMTPNTTFEATSKTLDDLLALRLGEHRDRGRDQDRQHEDAQDLVLDERRHEARGQQVVGDEADQAPASEAPASSIDSWPLARADSLGSPSKPEPGAKMFAASRPRVSAMTVIEKK